MDTENNNFLKLFSSGMNRRKLITRVVPAGVAATLLGTLAIPTYAKEPSRATARHYGDTSGEDLTGVWSFNANASKGSMSIFSIDPQGKLMVNVTFEGLNRMDHWAGVWNNTDKSITLTRSLPNNVTQNYVGYLGDNPPEHIILAGSFTESDIAPNAARTKFGWFAVWQNLIIV